MSRDSEAVENGLEQIFDDIREESQRALEEHGVKWHLPDIMWAGIAGEEGGEATKDAVGEADADQLRAEVIQAATMYIQWAQAIDQRGVIGWRQFEAEWRAGEPQAVVVHNALFELEGAVGAEPFDPVALDNAVSEARKVLADDVRPPA